jgi:hypothetical protein
MWVIYDGPLGGTRPRLAGEPLARRSGLRIWEMWRVWFSIRTLFFSCRGLTRNLGYHTIGVARQLRVRDGLTWQMKNLDRNYRYNGGFSTGRFGYAWCLACWCAINQISDACCLFCNLLWTWQRNDISPSGKIMHRHVHRTAGAKKWCLYRRSTYYLHLMNQSTSKLRSIARSMSTGPCQCHQLAPVKLRFYRSDRTSSPPQSQRH